MRLITFALIVLLIGPSLAEAQTYSSIDSRNLPLTRIFDPLTHGSEEITDYSFEELDYLMKYNLRFQRRNDLSRVCQSMELMFNRLSSRCSSIGAPIVSRLPVYSPKKDVVYAEIKFEIVKPVKHPIIIVDPIYPPWAPVYNPYGIWP